MSEKTSGPAPEKDRLLGHEADGIREFDNALPRWWLYGFYFTIVFGVAYLVNYHLLSSPLMGHRTLAEDYQEEMAVAEARFGRRGGNAGVLVAYTDPSNLEKGGEIFNGQRNLCHTCHRKDLGGVIGPNLTDNRWLHGCTAGELAQNITNGFPQKGMLPFGSGQRLSDEELLQVVSYVLSKRGSNPANPKATEPDRDSECR
jgi:cytochrome c oxidase cbb3-type subunit 3